MIQILKYNLATPPHPSKIYLLLHSPDTMLDQWIVICFLKERPGDLIKCLGAGYRKREKRRKRKEKKIIIFAPVRGRRSLKEELLDHFGFLLFSAIILVRRKAVMCDPCLHTQDVHYNQGRLVCAQLPHLMIPRSHYRAFRVCLPAKTAESF